MIETKQQLAKIAAEVFTDDNLRAFHGNLAFIREWHDEWARRYPGQYVLVGGRTLILVTGDRKKLRGFIDRYKPHANVVVRKLPVATHAAPA